MPTGAFLELVGTLTETDLGYTLLMDGGGFWIIELPGHPSMYLGKYVEVAGYQLGFNMLDARDLRIIDLHG